VQAFPKAFYNIAHI